MKIRGNLETRPGAPASPYIRAIVCLENGASARLNFLVDTGADRTAIHPVDALKLGIATLSPTAPGSTDTRGIGGTVQYTRQKASLTFKVGRNKTYKWVGEIEIGPCGADHWNDALQIALPSLLGRDFISRGKFVIDDVEGQVLLDTHPDALLQKKRDGDRMREMSSRQRKSTD